MLSGLESPMHLVVVLVIALLVFGPKRLPEMGRSLGAGIRQFKGSIDGSDQTTVEPTAAAPEASESTQAPHGEDRSTL
jgi:sec-independent protein translocase protein TatA